LEKYGFIYLWYDRKYKRYYIGSHWGTACDGYICSSVWMKNSYKRRPHDFKRRILQYIFDRTCILTEEHKWLSLIKDDEIGSKYYNLTKHHPGHWSTNDESRKTAGEKIAAVQRGNQNRKGKGFTDEAKKKISDTLKKTLSSDHEKARLAEQARGNKNRLGKRFSEESLAKMSANAHTKTFTFLSPEGELVTFTNMRKFCREHGLNRGNMQSVAVGRVKSCKGWRLPPTN